MEKTKVLSFAGFHSVLKRYLLNMAIRGIKEGEGTQEAVYRSLFREAYRKAEAGVPTESICRWVRGKALVSNRVRQAAMTAPEESCREYCEVFKKLKAKHVFLTPQQLSADLFEALKADKMQNLEYFKTERDDCEVMAFALVSALINDSIKKEIAIKPSIMSALIKANERCRESDNPFHSPYILDVLLEEEEMLLLRALNKLRAGLGSRYKEKMHEYAVKSYHSGTYDGEELENLDFIFYAKKCAFFEKRSEADQIDLIRGLFLTESRTIEKLMSITDDGDSLVEAMRQVAATVFATTTISVGKVGSVLAGKDKGGPSGEYDI